ncbi:putative digestive organ expansion factor, predicted [Rosa chinensis]|uniref:Putative digestive organ expansion factor, predicted n=2 Tax=Rosa chinensis TaxID=74649 RepID=A0A2P6QSU4_ROSCH|nr:U3 small nucleolar RNA-associated protein 25 isoform X1 [Rosa chinensis]XP_024193625.1 U3 small nucleolar RNA-associated protein 25 isoform X1 [Rosa chinensis]PRQ37230.1 putative digestive organ expansion factor, predicted [Rosa chinensis]
MGKQSGQNPGWRKRKMPNKFQKGGKSRRVEEEKVAAASPSSTSSGELLEEESNGVASEEEIVYKEPSMYDKLLMALGSSSKAVAAAYKQRKRQEEGKSDSDSEEEEDDDDDDDGTESSSDLEEVDDGVEGGDNEFPMKGKLKDPASEDAKTEDDQDTSDMDDRETSDSDDRETSDSDAEQDLGIHSQSAIDASICLSSFGVQLEHKLTEAEVENLAKKKWRYKWDVPAAGMSKGKWAGTGECCIKDVNPDSSYDLKQKLYKHWLDVYNTSGRKDFHSSKQRLFFSLFNSYRDILHCNKKPFYHRGSEEDSSVMDAYIMHCLNHIFRTRDLVMKNDSQVAKHQENAKNVILTDDSLRDHGFTRPKVLILLPMASIALRVVKRIIQLTPSAHKVNVDHMDRFSKEFGSEEVLDNEDVRDIPTGDQNSGNVKPHKSSKPSDFQVLFGGNSKDDFMVGIKFTKRSIKLYSDFYSSDMIVASAVGLLKKIDEAKINKEKDVDYLSSIEVLIIDHADVITMQNWDFLKSVVEQLNHQPSKQHGTDIMRIRPWYLDGHASFYRQTILLSYYSNPDINNLFNKHCTNYRGKVKLVHEYKGVLPKVVLQVRQIFQRFEGDEIVNIDDARFEHFATKVFPKIKNSVEGGIMIFISSYFEYVRVRNFLKSQNASFCLLHEYAEQKDISRARVWFFEGKRKIMLYTERAHFYHRYKIRGIQNLIVYSLPERKEFYPEVVNMVDGSHDMACTVLFSPFDLLRLERIVGTAPAKRMVSSKMNLFSFA